MKKYVVIFPLFTFFTFAFTQEIYTTKSDIPYYSESIRNMDEYLRERCMLDIYYPENKKNFPTVVWFHGGGLTSGNKYIPNSIKEKGIAVVAVNYRLYPKVKAPVYIEDAAAAVAWVFKNIPEYGGNKDLIFVSGQSAGAYLTCMLGLDKSWLNHQGVDANKIAGLISLSGQTITHLTVREERGIPDTQPLVDNLAPLFHVRKDAPSLLLITGDRELEMLGRYEENAYLMRMMKISGHQDTRLFELDGYGHSMTEPAFPLLVKEIQRIVGLKK